MANAVDGDAGTRYYIDTGQAAGQYLDVDFGKQIPARQVVFDTLTGSSGSWWSVADVRAYVAPGSGDRL